MTDRWLRDVRGCLVLRQNDLDSDEKQHDASCQMQGRQRDLPRRQDVLAQDGCQNATAAGKTKRLKCQTARGRVVHSGREGSKRARQALLGPA
jgi:hypothetical protein